MPNRTGHRYDRSYRIANWSQIQQVFYTLTLAAFVHRWAIVILTILVPSAMTVLQFLAALNRSSKSGFSGCAVAYQLLSQQIEEATNRKCSVRTLERGIAFLRKVGLVKLHWWTMPDQTFANGPYKHTIKGTAKVETRSGWKSQQIRIIVLTDLAIALWDRSTEKRGSDIIPHFAHLLTPAKMAANPQIEQIDKSIMLQVTDPKSDTSTVIDKDGLEEQGSTTRPHGAVEHDSSTPSQLPTSSNAASSTSVPSMSPENASDSISQPTKGRKQRDQESCQSEMPSIDEFVSGILGKTTKPTPRKTRKKQPVARGTTHTPPPLPKHASVKTSWSVARAYILVELDRCLQNFATYEANSIYERAMYELSPEYPTGFPTVVDWPYWVSKFALFSRQERTAHMCRDILPLIKAKYVPVPSEPSRFREAKMDPRLLRTPLPEKLAGFLDPVLEKMWNKFAK